jgi:hypothetical protein
MTLYSRNVQIYYSLVADITRNQCHTWRERLQQALHWYAPSIPVGKDSVLCLWQR